VLLRLIVRGFGGIESESQETTERRPLLDEPFELLDQVHPHPMGATVAIPRVTPERGRFTVFCLHLHIPVDVPAVVAVGIVGALPTALRTTITTLRDALLAIARVSVS
jgi:hypothetical protein